MLSLIVQGNMVALCRAVRKHSLIAIASGVSGGFMQSRLAISVLRGQRKSSLRPNRDEGMFLRSNSLSILDMVLVSDSRRGGPLRFQSDPRDQMH